MKYVLSLLGDHPIYKYWKSGLQFSTEVLENISSAEPRQ